jgi:hypothetical protein
VRVGQPIKEDPFMSKKSDRFEQLVCNITGGVWQSGINPKSPYDVMSGNNTRLEAKHTMLQCPLGTPFWRWNVGNKLVPGHYDRMILGGYVDSMDDIPVFFDVPIRWILAWNAPEIRSNRNGCHGYTLYKWLICTEEQLADRYGPGKARQLEISTPEQEELLRKWEEANEAEAQRAFNWKLSELSIIEFIVRKFEAYGTFSPVELGIIRAMPSAVMDSIHSELCPIQRDRFREKLKDS